MQTYDTTPEGVSNTMSSLEEKLDQLDTAVTAVEDAWLQFREGPKPPAVQSKSQAVQTDRLARSIDGLGEMIGRLHMLAESIRGRAW